MAEGSEERGQAEEVSWKLVVVSMQCRAYILRLMIDSACYCVGQTNSPQKYASPFALPITCYSFCFQYRHHECEFVCSVGVDVGNAFFNW